MSSSDPLQTPKVKKTTRAERLAALKASSKFAHAIEGVEKDASRTASFIQRQSEEKDRREAEVAKKADRYESKTPGNRKDTEDILRLLEVGDQGGAMALSKEKQDGCLKEAKDAAKQKNKGEKRQSWISSILKRFSGHSRGH